MRLHQDKQKIEAKKNAPIRGGFLYVLQLSKDFFQTETVVASAAFWTDLCDCIAYTSFTLRIQDFQCGFCASGKVGCQHVEICLVCPDGVGSTCRNTFSCRTGGISCKQFWNHFGQHDYA